MAVKNVTVFFEDGSRREFGNCAWNWLDGVLSIMKHVGPFRRSVPVAQIPFDAVRLVDIEYDDDDGEMA